jgi:predicted dehydrogenase
MVVRTGVLGVGSLGFHHARILRSLPGAELVGVHDANPARLTTVTAELGVQAFADAEALLDKVAAVVIAVPTVHHERVATLALDRGVHVLLEKPVADSLEAAERIVSRAAAAGALLQIGHVERFNGVLRACERYLDEPLFVESHRLAPFSPRGVDVPVVLDLMIHDLDLVFSLIRQAVASVEAIGVPVLTPSPDIANARIEFEGGAVANLTASRVSLERRRKIRFFQRSGYISLDLAAGTGEYLRLREGGLGRAAAVENLAELRLDDVVERVELRSDGTEPLRAELESFLHAVAGRRPVAVTGEDGVRALAMALEIVRKIDARVAHTNPA